MEEGGKAIQYCLCFTTSHKETQQVTRQAGELHTCRLAWAARINRPLESSPWEKERQGLYLPIPGQRKGWGKWSTWIQVQPEWVPSYCGPPMPLTWPSSPPWSAHCCSCFPLVMFAPQDEPPLISQMPSPITTVVPVHSSPEMARRTRNSRHTAGWQGCTAGGGHSIFRAGDWPQ